MTRSHRRFSAILAITVALALSFGTMAVTFAAPGGGASGSRSALADHVDPGDCDAITVDAGGNILVNAVVLTAAQLALLDADTTAALMLAAAADASASADVTVCVDVVLGTGNLVTVNADISVCSATVTINGDGSVDIGDVTVAAELLDARLLAALQLAVDAAADADTEACVVVTVTDSDVVVDVVEVDAIVTLCATLLVDANGDTTINGTLLDSDQFIDTSSETDFTTAVEVGVRITATVEIDGDIFVLVEAFDLAGCGSTAGGGDPTGMVMVMKHLCNASIQSEADFQAVEARAATNPTTPMGVPSLGATAETVLACPVIVQPGDSQTPGAIGAGSRAFDFTVTDSAATTQTLTADTTFSGDNGFTTAVEDFACETNIAYDADRDGTVEAGVCLDFSSYSFDDVVEGDVTVAEIAAPPGTRFGTVRLTPPALSDDAAIGLSFTAAGTITFDSSADDDAMVMLHVYNFQAATVATPAPSATPAVSVLPDAAALPVDRTNPTSGLAAMLAVLALGSLSLMGYRVLKARRTH